VKIVDLYIPAVLNTVHYLIYIYITPPRHNTHLKGSRFKIDRWN